MGDVGPGTAALPELAADDREKCLERNEEREEHDETEKEAGGIPELGHGKRRRPGRGAGYAAGLYVSGARDADCGVSDAFVS